MNPIDEHRQRVTRNTQRLGEDRDFIGLTNIWIREAIHKEYALNFTWLGRPVVQFPQDVYAIQELIWACRPDTIIETGIAHGGSLILSASMLALMDYCDAAVGGTAIDPRASHRKVIGVDIDIRAHNRSAIEAHPLAHKIEMIQGSSVDPSVIAKVSSRASGGGRVMVFLDSNHTHDHVLAELEAYAPLTSKGSYCIVWDTSLENLPEGFYADRPWDKGNNPKTAVWAYLQSLAAEPPFGADGTKLSFEIDKAIEHRVAITAAFDGFLRRI